MTVGQIVAGLVALVALAAAFALLATRARDGGVRPAIHGTVRPAPSPGPLMPSPDGAAVRMPVRATFTVPAEAGATIPGSRMCRCGTPVIRPCTDGYGRRRVVVDATPHRDGTWEFIEPAAAGARVMAVDPAVKIRPTYRTHQCTEVTA